MTTIVEIPEQDKPREKLLSKGASNLTDTELLAIILATSGMKGRSVLDLARDILRLSDCSLRNLSRVDLEELKRVKGVGNSKAILIKAVFELAQRHERERPQDNLIFRSPKEIASYFIPKFRHMQQEIFTVLLFDRRSHLIKEKQIGIGSSVQVSVEPREVFYSAISMRASSVILMHNHPSGSVKPSKYDEIFTDKMLQAGKALNIPVLDHIILGTDSFYSFRENLKIKK